MIAVLGIPTVGFACDFAAVHNASAMCGGIRYDALKLHAPLQQQNACLHQKILVGVDIERILVRVNIERHLGIDPHCQYLKHASANLNVVPFFGVLFWRIQGIECKAKLAWDGITEAASSKLYKVIADMVSKQKIIQTLSVSTQLIDTK